MCRNRHYAASMNLHKIDLNLLATLDTLLRERSVTRAGRQLALSQSAVSERLARLRVLFNDDLLTRVGQRLEPTEFAQGLQASLRDCLMQMRSLVERQALFDPARDAHSFSIAATESNAYLLMPPLLARLRELAPRVSVRFVPANTASIELLENAQLDFFIMAHRLESTLPAVPLFRERWVCAAWRGNTRIGTQLSHETFAALPHLVTTMYPLPETYSFADETAFKLGLHRRVIGSTSNFFLAPFMLRGTDALLLMQERFAHAIMAAAELRLYPVPFALPAVDYDLVWNPRREGDPRHRWLRGLLQQIVAAQLPSFADAPEGIAE